MKQLAVASPLLCLATGSSFAGNTPEK